MPDLILVGCSALVLVFAASQAAVLVHGSHGRERMLWQILTVVLLLGALGRIGNVFSLSESGLTLPLWVRVTLLTNPLTVAVVLVLIRPTLRSYRDADRLRRASDEAFQRSFTESRDPLAIIDRGGAYVDVNDAGLQVFRYERAQVIGQPFRAFLLGDADPRGLVEQALATGVARIEGEVRRGDGTRIPVECDLINLGNDRVLIVGRDISSRRAAEANRLRVERLSASHDLVGSVGADLRELLSFMKSSLELTGELGQDRVALDASIGAATQALRLLDEFTAVVSDEPRDVPDWPPFDVLPALQALVEESRTALSPGVEITLYAPATPVMVLVPEPAIRQIGLALIAHAVVAATESVQATPPGRWFRGRINVHLQWTTDDRQVEIVVEDNARTIDAELRSSMFEPLGPAISPTRPGLGAIHALVLRLDGALLVERGTEGGHVLVRLPGARTPG